MNKKIGIVKKDLGNGYYLVECSLNDALLLACRLDKISMKDAFKKYFNVWE
jgi:hypothetical protein